jgi:hypothetical protein
MMGKFFAIIVIVLVLILIVGKCAGDDDVYDPEVEMAKIRADEGFDSRTLPATNEGFTVSAPSDPGASYRILKIDKMANGNLEVVSRRDGPSGTSFARREINCAGYSYRYLGEGDTREEAEADGANIGEMSALTGTSASSDVANAACTRRR